LRRRPARRRRRARQQRPRALGHALHRRARSPQPTGWTAGRPRAPRSSGRWRCRPRRRLHSRRLWRGRRRQWRRWRCGRRQRRCQREAERARRNRAPRARAPLGRRVARLPGRIQQPAQRRGGRAAGRRRLRTRGRPCIPCAQKPSAYSPLWARAFVTEQRQCSRWRTRRGCACAWRFHRVLRQPARDQVHVTTGEACCGSPQGG